MEDGEGFVCYLIFLHAFPHTELGSPLGQGTPKVLCSYKSMQLQRCGAVRAICFHLSVTGKKTPFFGGPVSLLFPSQWLKFCSLQHQCSLLELVELFQACSSKGWGWELLQGRFSSSWGAPHICTFHDEPAESLQSHWGFRAGRKIKSLSVG